MRLTLAPLQITDPLHETVPGVAAVGSSFWSEKIALIDTVRGVELVQEVGPRMGSWPCMGSRGFHGVESAHGVVGAQGGVGWLQGVPTVHEVAMVQEVGPWQGAASGPLVQPRLT